MIVRSAVATNICPALLFLTHSYLEGQLEGHLFLGLIPYACSWVIRLRGSMSIFSPGTEIERIAFG